VRVAVHVVELPRHQRPAAVPDRGLQ
jgi:hypothetical protein